LYFTSKPVEMSVDITSELYDLMKDHFPTMHLVTPQEIAAQLASLPGTHPFDVESIKGGHVPGVGYKYDKSAFQASLMAKIGEDKNQKFRRG